VWSLVLQVGFGRGANDSTLQTSTVTKIWRRPRHTLGCSASKVVVVVVVVVVKPSGFLHPTEQLFESRLK
jgi:hypothetical protein